MGCCPKATIDAFTQNMGDLMRITKRIEREKKLKQFLLSLGGAGEIADKVSDLILFHNRVRKNAEKRYM